ncbi:MAG: MgtC/SapB family protein [Acidimicrobiia bacterium]|nr:MgtC/SapB family protein [Acidimicrobiia bacterium]
MLDLDTWEMVGRVALAALLGGAIGVEREIGAQPAGFRTHVVLCLGAALFGLISVHAFDPFATGGDTNVQVDVSRVASQVVVGVGFLGGGAILKERGAIRGLTTAASMWVTAAIGLAVGLGYWQAGLTVTIATLIALVVLRWVRRVLRSRVAAQAETVTFRLRSEADPSGVVTALHALAGVEVQALRLDRDDETRQLTVVATLKSRPWVHLDVALAPLSERPEVDEMVVAR